MIQPNLPVPWPSTISHFLHPAPSLLFSRYPSATIASFISFLSLSLLCYYRIPLPGSSPFSIFVSLPLAASVFISLSLHILVSSFFSLISPYLSHTGQAQGWDLGNGEHRALMPHVVIGFDTMGETLARVLLPRTTVIQTCEDSHKFGCCLFPPEFLQHTWTTAEWTCQNEHVHAVEMLQIKHRGENGSMTDEGWSVCSILWLLLNAVYLQYVSYVLLCYKHYYYRFCVHQAECITLY